MDVRVPETSSGIIRCLFLYFVTCLGVAAALSMIHESHVVPTPTAGTCQLGSLPLPAWLVDPSLLSSPSFPLFIQPICDSFITRSPFLLSALRYSPRSVFSSLSDNILAKRCEGGTKCFLLSINNVLYACVAPGPPGVGGKGRVGGWGSPGIYPPLNLFVSEFF